MERIIDKNLIKTLLPPVDDKAHKGTNGTLAIVAGCKKYQGAATLATKSALKCGVGLIYANIVDDIYVSFCNKVSSAVTISHKSKNGAFKQSNITKLLNGQKRADVILIGSGISDEKNALKLTKSAIKSDYNLVIDGDGLLSVAKNLRLFKNRKAKTIITPHLGEFSRICGLKIGEIKKDMASIATKFASDNNMTVVLKDYKTVIATANGDCFIMDNPNMALAKATSGDILCGAIASLFARFKDEKLSAVLGVYLHNTASHIALKDFAKDSLSPYEIINYFNQVFLDLRG